MEARFLNIIKITEQARRAIMFLVVLAVLIPGLAVAQGQEEKTAPAKVFDIKPRAADAVTLVSGKSRITLWGILPVDGVSPAFSLKVRTALENTISGSRVQCELKKRTSTVILAQCVNRSDLDLGLFMIQQGYVSVDRSVVYGTIFEEAYIQAEVEAQTRGLGIWAEENEKESGAGPNSNTMLSFGFALFVFIIVCFTGLSIIIMRGFQKVIDAQNENVEMMGKERELRDKERKIVAVMLDSEIKANKAKIEAFLVVYDEMMKSLKDPEKQPKYKTAGDIIQKQPALDRGVFDRNTDKLDVLGKQLSSQVVHYYARIKSQPEYVDLEPDMDKREAIEILEKVLESAKRLDKLADRLIDAFQDSGVVES